MNREDSVREFMEAFGQAVDGLWTEDILELRCKLIAEEVQEVIEELFDYQTETWIEPSKVSKARVLKELTDLQYVVSGMAVALGLNLDEAFERVHRSNMSKLLDNGQPLKREDGKVLKGPNYIPPVMDDLV